MSDIRPSSSLDNQKKKGKSSAKQAHHLWLDRTPLADLEPQKVNAQALTQVRESSALGLLRNLGQTSTQAPMETSQQHTTFISNSPELVFPTVGVLVQRRANPLDLLRNRGRLEKPSSLNDLKTLPELLQFIPTEHHNAIRDAYRRAKKAFKKAANKERKGPKELVSFVEQYYSVECEEKRGTLYYQFKCLDPEKCNAAYNRYRAK